MPQADHLTENDLSAAWSVLSRLDGKYLVIYNCGFEGGSSVGHKHLQILPRPEREEFEFFPDMLGISEGILELALGFSRTKLTFWKILAPYRRFHSGTQ